MRIVIPVFSVMLLSFYSCSDKTENSKLHLQIDSLRQKLDDTYKPGLGEFMSGIQVHHAKLWFAGINKNWRLADFEIGEITESFDDIKKYCTDRSEIKFLYLIDPALDSMNNAVRAQDTLRFRNCFDFLTSTCNNCHRSVNYNFNVVKTPATPPFSNQEFIPSK